MNNISEEDYKEFEAFRKMQKESILNHKEKVSDVKVDSSESKVKKNVKSFIERFEKSNKRKLNQKLPSKSQVESKAKQEAKQEVKQEEDQESKQEVKQEEDQESKQDSTDDSPDELNNNNKKYIKDVKLIDNISDYIITKTDTAKKMRKKYIITDKGFRFLLNSLYVEKKKVNVLTRECNVCITVIRSFKKKVDDYISNKLIDKIEYFDIFGKKPKY